MVKNSTFVRCGALFVVAIVCGSSLFADPPSVFQFLKRDKIEAKEGIEYKLTAENGPWLIFAATFDDVDAQAKANALVLELRQRYRLNAYIHSAKFDFTKTVEGSGFDENGQPKKMRYQDDRLVDSFAVLVGNFSSLDSPDIEEAKKTLKYAHPQTLGGQGDPRTSSFDTATEWIAGFRYGNRQKAKEGDGPKRGPMRIFVTKNPLLPDDYFQPPKVDDFIRKLNKEVDHSLLDCPGRFTVKVATFRGNEGVAIGKDAKKLMEEKISDGLDRAAEMANLTATVLRKEGVQAYAFHDRTSSIVTIGSFDSIGQNDQQGQFQYHPAIVPIITMFTAQTMTQTQYGTVPLARTLLDVVPASHIPELSQGTDREKMKAVKKYAIPFDPQPKVIAVPKPESKSVYSGSLLGNR
jgi:hypothetical protein